MQKLLTKLNYKGQKRIAILEGENGFAETINSTLPEITIDTIIDQRFPYEFMLIFVRRVADIDNMAPQALHNLTADGILWFAYPKKSSRKYCSDIYRDHGWEVLIDRGMHPVRQVSVDDDWSALRFRNSRYIKSSSDRFSK